MWATETASQSQALVLLGDLSLIFVKSGNTTWHTQFRKFLQISEDNFGEVVEESEERCVLALVLTNQEALVEDVKVGDSIGSSDH